MSIEKRLQLLLVPERGPPKPVKVRERREQNQALVYNSSLQRQSQAWMHIHGPILFQNDPKFVNVPHSQTNLAWSGAFASYAPDSLGRYARAFLQRSSYILSSVRTCDFADGFVAWLQQHFIAFGAKLPVPSVLCWLAPSPIVHFADASRSALRKSKTVPLVCDGHSLYALGQDACRLFILLASVVVI